jgi:secretion/DNA translocation related TadE-like protein
VNERGAAATVLVGVVAVVLVLAVALADVGAMLATRLQAAAAADAAALAAAPATFRSFGADGSPAEAAATIATANGARLVECRCPFDPSWWPRRVEVTVADTVDLILLGTRDVTATSAADFTPVALHEP